MPSTVAALVLTHDRPQEVIESLASLDPGFDQVVVLDNGSPEALSISLAGLPDLEVVRSEENLGVSGGRNRLIELCRCDYAVFIDDDAVARTELSTGVRRRFDDDPALGAQAFHIVRPEGPMSHEYPFRGEVGDVESERPCAYFVGAGFALRLEAVEATGAFDRRFFYGCEEIDLSMSLAREGWSISYVPSLSVEHRPSTRGRRIRPQIPGFLLTNRLIYARKHLPPLPATVHAATWVGRSLLEALRGGSARASLMLWPASLVAGIRAPVERHPLPRHLLGSLHRLGGRVWW